MLSEEKPSTVEIGNNSGVYIGGSAKGNKIHIGNVIKKHQTLSISIGIAAIALTVYLFISLGGGAPPTVSQLVGTWESESGILLTFYEDGDVSQSRDLYSPFTKFSLSENLLYIRDGLVGNYEEYEVSIKGNQLSLKLISSNHISSSGTTYTYTKK